MRAVVLSCLWLLVALLAACGEREDATRLGRTVSQLDRVPHLTQAQLAEGERLFDHYCAQCHGLRAAGTAQGPPLVHIVYEPSHHGDYAFAYAVTQGVRAHHWNFGNMPPVEGIEPEEIIKVIGYLRQLQRQAGIH